MLLPVLLVFLYLGLVSATARDFSLNPTASRPCLYAATDASACDTSTVPKFNACVCSNGGGFLDSAASCLGPNDSDEVGSVYSIMSRNCGDSSTPIAFTLAKWNAAASLSSSSERITSVITSPSTVNPPASIVAPTTVSVSAVVVTVTQAPASGQTSAVLSFVTLAPGQSTQISILPYTSVSRTETATGTGTGTVVPQTSTGTSSSTAVPSSASKLGTGIIVGIAVGTAVILALLGLGLVLFLCWRNHTIGGSSKSAAGAPPLSGPSGAPAGKYYQRPAIQQVHQYPSPTSPSVAVYSEQAKYNNAYPPAQRPGHEAYDHQSPVSINPPYGRPPAAYTAPPPQGGAVELAGRPGAPTWAHEMPAH
ncbi:hypothetical protein FKW77_000398 [Venturia effusa]|uniref:Extracellular membrane protein CFEM domain-containing protein n=1 Tax=Venturia effusa TaxID=50376 RepID=A0A517LM26_9PEZI|nr:hypothetical protein FKW77_000398 [Venturia effusa]